MVDIFFSQNVVTFILSFFGVIISEFAYIYNIRKSIIIPEHLKSYFYYFSIFIMGIISGIIALSYKYDNNINIPNLLAIQIGAGMPLMINKFSSHSPIDIMNDKSK